MSEGPEIPWWEQRAQKSSERRSAEAQENAPAQPGDSFLIVTEGTVTEPVYFEELRQSMELSQVKVKVMPGEASDPRHVIRSAAREVENLARLAKKKCTSLTELESYDHVWAVIDTDVAERKGFWNDVVQLASAKSVKLARSTPCFEYWLYLHLKYSTKATFTNGAAAKKAVKDELGEDYSTNRKVAEEVFPRRFIPHWRTAVENCRTCRKHHETGGTPSPANPSTDVDLLVTALECAMPLYTREGNSQTR